MSKEDIKNLIIQKIDEKIQEGILVDYNYAYEIASDIFDEKYDWQDDYIGEKDCTYILEYCTDYAWNKNKE